MGYYDLADFLFNIAQIVYTIFLFISVILLGANRFQTRILKRYFFFLNEKKLFTKVFIASAIMTVLMLSYSLSYYLLDNYILGGRLIHQQLLFKVKNLF